MTDEELAQLQALADAATPGPWEHHDTIGPSDLSPDGTTAVLALRDRRWVAQVHDECGSNNSDFLAAARTAVPALVEEVRRLRAELESKRRQFGLLLSTRDGKFAESKVEARRAERERCAKVADACFPAAPSPEWDACQTAITATIRALPDEP